MNVLNNSLLNMKNEFKTNPINWQKSCSYESFASKFFNPFAFHQDPSDKNNIPDINFYKDLSQLPKCLYFAFNGISRSVKS